MRLIQCEHEGRLRVAVVESPEQVRLVNAEEGVYGLAKRAIAEKRSLTELVESELTDTRLDYAELIEQQRLRAPLTHPDPAHCLISGTGLTHLGSADTRSAMHAKAQAAESELTDSMRMFKMGVDGGKPQDGQPGAQPEWFYKGDGSIVVDPEAALPVPSFAEDAGEEPELAGLYVVGDDGQPWRVGYAVGNEFSDHVTERHNYLWLAHSKLRACSYGPELLVGDLPEHLEGTSRIVRDGQVLWEKPFLTGEANMAHSLANLEYHHFKYPSFRRPGDVHVHYFGTATLSFADNIRTRDGDRFEVDLPAFGRPLRNPLRFSSAETPVAIKAL
ncbi:FAH family protein [Halomonas sp. McH1-25]|uniref:AraD1 family protein n=1 Tax=unclassified Halomonas TaxID=2609666 RepID=UPI001EF54427|nr:MULTISPECIES: AraD1 family protein [unclassified Halomonas]MCG7602287.1 FAH family protein [Halomonas sp. McH1-25]MCP1344825.1 GguC family protein [Halomonas sp. FL8]MCP1363606.1 GguC family protein [Halomonas sp. BBD45]